MASPDGHEVFTNGKAHVLLVDMMGRLFEPIRQKLAAYEDYDKLLLIKFWRCAGAIRQKTKPLAESLFSFRQGLCQRCCVLLIRRFSCMTVNLAAYFSSIPAPIPVAVFGFSEPCSGLNPRGYIRKQVQCVPWNYPSSQLCHYCGYKNPAVKDLHVRHWTFPCCQAHHDRDINATINILNKARALVSAAG